jgi:hypothetical protein
MFGIGIAEMVIIAAIPALLVGVPLIVILAVLIAVTQSE